MKNIMKKNKVLFLAMAIVIVCGACLAIVLVSQAHTAMAAEQIVTAEAEAAETPAPTEAAAAPTAEATAAPQATAVNTTLSAEDLSFLVEMKERRRNYIIPSLDNVVLNEADTWQSVESKSYSAEVLSSAALYAKAFFVYDMTEDNVSYQYFTDTSGNRGDIIRVSTKDDAIVCTLAADTLDLIEIDYYFIPAEAQTDDDGYLTEENFKTVPDGDRKIVDNIAATFDSTISNINASGGSGGRHGVWTKNYALKLKNGKLMQISLMNGTLYAIGVHPSEAAMYECVYFDADVQMGQPLSSEQDFKKGQPGAGDMTQENALKFYMAFMTIANTDGEYGNPKMTFYIDNSGKRENYWHIDGKKMTMDVASTSKRIISLTCDNLWNPTYDLTKVKYESMGGKEYETYVSNIMKDLYGSGFKNASNNAVYDFHFCTEDAWMTDGSVYEFMFEDGKLQQVFFYADEECFRAALSGWKADHEYVNSASGETFIPN